MTDAGSLKQFLSMGGYGAYVWPSYAIAVTVILGMAAHSLLTWRRWRDRVRALEKNGGAE